jgi:hypothetical protein
MPAISWSKRKNADGFTIARNGNDYMKNEEETASITVGAYKEVFHLYKSYGTPQEIYAYWQED